MISRLQIFTCAILITVGSLASACPITLDLNPIHATPELTLCQAFDRYHKAVFQLHAQGYTQVRRIGNLMAPRFINMPDWLAKRTGDADSGKRRLQHPAVGHQHAHHGWYGVRSARSGNAG